MNTSSLAAATRLVRPLTAAVFVLAACGVGATQDLRATLRRSGDDVALSLHAVGVQIYECRTGTDGILEWRFKSPQADLYAGSEHVGRHYAGPTWEYRDGSRITGMVVASAASPEPHSVPWLRLSVATHAGKGAFDDIGVVLRIDTQGGVITGRCNEAETSTSVPYTANYLFVRAR